MKLYIWYDTKNNEIILTERWTKKRNWYRKMRKDYNPTVLIEADWVLLGSFNDGGI